MVKSFLLLYWSLLLGNSEINGQSSFNDEVMHSIQRKMSRTAEINLLHPDMSNRSVLTNLTNQSVSSANSSAVGLNTSGRKISSDWGSRDGIKMNSENILSLDTVVAKDITLKSAPPTAIITSNIMNKASGFSFSDK